MRFNRQLPMRFYSDSGRNEYFWPMNLQRQSSMSILLLKPKTAYPTLVVPPFEWAAKYHVANAGPPAAVMTFEFCRLPVVGVQSLRRDIAGLFPHLAG